MVNRPIDQLTGDKRADLGAISTKLDTRCFRGARELAIACTERYEGSLDIEDKLFLSIAIYAGTSRLLREDVPAKHIAGQLWRDATTDLDPQHYNAVVDSGARLVAIYARQFDTERAGAFLELIKQFAQHGSPEARSTFDDALYEYNDAKRRRYPNAHSTDWAQIIKFPKT